MTNTFTPNQGCRSFGAEINAHMKEVDEHVGDKICVMGKCQLFGCLDLDTQEVPNATGTSTHFVTTCTLSINKCECPHCHPVCGDLFMVDGQVYKVLTDKRLSEDGCDYVWNVAESNEHCNPCQ